MNSNCKFSDLQKLYFVTFIYSSTKTRYYSGLYEKEISGGNTCEYCYITGGDGLAAVYITENGGAGSIYYILTDHLGSINMLIDNTGAIAQFNGQTQEYSFDACLPTVSRFHREKVGGRLRNPNDWSYNNVPAPVFTCRGFTGHEHLDDFNLINMSRWLSGGRMYDPYLGRFLSPDNYVQMPDATQSFNRYSYCLNNPLKYTDPDGEFWHLVIGAIIGGTMNLIMNADKVDNFWEGLGYFGVGAAAGALGAGVGVGIQTASAGASFWAGFVGSSQGISTILSVGYTSGFVNGALAGAGAGFASGFVTGTGNGLMQGQSFGDALGSGLKTGAISGASGALLSGFAGVIDAYRDGRSFWDGGPTLETKLEILLKNNNAELMSEIGEAGVGDVTLGTNRNLQGTGYRNAGGSMMSPDGDLVNGFHRQGRTFDISVDGYARLNNNKIYLSKSTVRQMWRGSATAKETLFHEWYHARDYYTGYASFLHSKNSSNYTYMLEFRAHSFNYSRLATPNRLMLMEHYARLYWGLPGLF